MMEMIRRRWWVASIVLVLTVFAGQSSLQADVTTEKIMAKLKAKAANLKSYRADMVMTIDMMGQKLTTNGKIIFKRPNKMWMEMVTKIGAMEMKQITVADGKAIWTHQPMMNMVSKIDLEKIAAETGEEMTGQDTADISKPFEGLEREGISYLRTEKLDGKTVYVFRGTPKKAPVPTPFTPDKAELWLDGEHGVIRKVTIFDREGKEVIVQSYDNLEVNAEVPDSQFEFTVPEGAQVLDMTETYINMAKQSKGK